MLPEGARFALSRYGYAHFEACSQWEHASHLLSNKLKGAYNKTSCRLCLFVCCVSVVLSVVECCVVCCCCSFIVLFVILCCLLIVVCCLLLVVCCLLLVVCCLLLVVCCCCLLCVVVACCVRLLSVCLCCYGQVSINFYEKMKKTANGTASADPSSYIFIFSVGIIQERIIYSTIEVFIKLCILSEI